MCSTSDIFSLSDEQKQTILGYFKKIDNAQNKQEEDTHYNQLFKYVSEIYKG